MDLKGYRLWVMCQLDSNVQSPTAEDVDDERHAAALRAHAHHHLRRRRRVVAPQVAFERQTLKPVFSLDRL
jgi:hypothetical protein